MTIKNVSHVAIAVRDMDRAIPFWTEAAGLRISLDAIEEVPGPHGTQRRRAVYLRQSDSQDAPFIVLDQLIGGESPGDAKAMFEIGVHHFGFWVDDVELIAERVKTTGHKILFGPVQSGSERYGEPEGTFVWTLLVHDPDGNVIQFDQRVDDVAREAVNA